MRGDVPAGKPGRAVTYTVREANPGDVQEMAALMRAYMLETYRETWRGGVAGLLEDGFGMRFRTLLALLEARPVGMLAWEESYDLHHCLTGGHILDLYVVPAHRSRAVAVRLLLAASRIVHAGGGAFIKGGAVDTGTGTRLYGRFAPAFGNDFILGGKAFRHLATLPEPLSDRQLARSMPGKEWNFEP